MKTVNAFLLVATVAVSARAEDIPMPEGMSAADYVYNLTYGGDAVRPKSGYGRMLILNGQNRVAAAELTKAIKTIQDEVFVAIDLVGKAEKAEATISIIDKEGEGALAIYPEEMRAVVNVAALAKDKPSPEKLAERTRKEILRAFSYIGGITGGAEGALMDVMSDLSRLDKAEERVPGEISIRNENYLARAGLKVWQKTTYKDACEEGWADKPTNVWQKAVWDQVHQKPTKGLKIKYDPKKGE